MRYPFHRPLANRRQKLLMLELLEPRLTPANLLAPGHSQINPAGDHSFNPNSQSDAAPTPALTQRFGSDLASQPQPGDPGDHEFQGSLTIGNGATSSRIVEAGVVTANGAVSLVSSTDTAGARRQPSAADPMSANAGDLSSATSFANPVISVVFVAAGPTIELLFITISIAPVSAPTNEPSAPMEQPPEKTAAAGGDASTSPSASRPTLNVSNANSPTAAISPAANVTTSVVSDATQRLFAAAATTVPTPRAFQVSGDNSLEARAASLEPLRSDPTRTTPISVTSPISLPRGGGGDERAAQPVTNPAIKPPTIDSGGGPKASADAAEQPAETADKQANVRVWLGRVVAGTTTGAVVLYFLLSGYWSDLVQKVRNRRRRTPSVK
jgi:hypothetical protein